MRLLLASKSETRRRMLEQAGVPFETVDSPLDEEAAKRVHADLSPRDLAVLLATLKAGSAAAGPNELVLGADQTLECQDGTLLNKPASRDELLAQLRALSGRTHQLHSGAVIMQNHDVIWSGIESVTMTMRLLGEDFLQTYLDGEYAAVRWNVGGYRIEGLGAQLFDRVEGSHFAILGLPLLPLLAFLRERSLLAS